MRLFSILTQTLEIEHLLTIFDDLDERYGARELTSRQKNYLVRNRYYLVRTR